MDQLRRKLRRRPVTWLPYLNIIFMQTKRQILCFILCLGILNLAGQSAIKITDSTHIFWREGVTIKYEDYRGPSFPNTIPVIAEIAIWTALDRPANDQNLFLPVHFYISPVFDRSSSHADTHDPALIAVNNIYFSISELCARKARKKMIAALDTLQLSSNVSAIFKNVVKEMHEQRLLLNRKFHREYFKNKNQDAITQWNSQLNNELKLLSKWSTSFTDIQRFMNSAPLEKSYKEDLSCNPKLLGDKYEQVLSPDSWHAGYNQISRFTLRKD